MRKIDSIIIFTVIIYNCIITTNNNGNKNCYFSLKSRSLIVWY